jgi:hypothetical protein
MLSLMFAPLRWLLSLTGAGTDRAEGIRLFQVTAAQGHYLRHSRMMLAVAALRDSHPQRARDIPSSLSREFPKIVCISANSTIFIEHRENFRPIPVKSQRTASML